LLELYYSVESTCAQKVRLVLAEKSLDWRERLLNLRKGEQFAAGYLRLNPKGVVPTLIHDGAVIRESTVINEYIDQVFPDPPMRPGDARDQARMRLWTKAFDEEIHPAVGIVTYATTLRHQMNRLKTPDELAAHFAAMPDPARRERQRLAHDKGIDAPHVAGALRVLDAVIGRMEDALSDTPWLAGAEYSLADAAATPYLVRLDMLRFDGLWRDRGDRAGRRGHVADWFDRARARRNARALDDAWGPPSFVDLLNTHGAEAWPRAREMLRQGDDGPDPS
jgi:glutathione S-transferase